MYITSTCIWTLKYALYLVLVRVEARLIGFRLFPIVRRLRFVTAERLDKFHSAKWICPDPREVDSAVAEDLVIADAVDSGIEAGKYEMMVYSAFVFAYGVVSRSNGEMRWCG